MISIVVFSVGMPDLANKSTGHNIIGTWPRSPSACLAATCFSRPCLPSATCPVVFVHEFAYEILSQLIVLYLSLLMSLGLSTDTIMIDS